MSSRRRVALLCIDPWKWDVGLQPFNYSARRVHAALALGPSGPDFEVRLIESKETNADEFVARVEEFDPDVVGFSTFVWSLPTFVQVAARLKRSRPDRLLIFGGPSARPVMFDLPRWHASREHVDALVLGEGELVFRQIVELARPDRDALAAISGLALWTGTAWRHTGPPTLVTNLDALPSVYDAGAIESSKSAHLETFRGCPLECAFCQWGDMGSNSRVFSADAIEKELLAIGALGLDLALSVDAAINLNAKAFKNLVEAERRTGVLKKVPLAFEAYPVRLDDAHMDFLSSIRVRAIGVGVQSYDREVLKRLHRSFDERRFNAAVEQLVQLASVSLEIILGLPGDNPRSFRYTLERVRELPCEVRVYHCMVLPDALMTRAPPGTHMVFDHQTLDMVECDGWTPQDLREAHALLERAVEETGGYAIGNFYCLAPPKGKPAASVSAIL